MTIEEMKAEILSKDWAWLCRSLEQGEILKTERANYFVNISCFDREMGVITGGAERSCKAVGETELEAFQSAFLFWKSCQ